MSAFDAIVVGAGCAGLSAAAAMAERGARVLVLEARPGLGGRATAFTDPATGERVDNGQHVLLGCYHETFRFLRRIGAGANVRTDERLAVDFVDRGGRASRLSCPALPAPFHLLGGLLRWDALSWRDRASAFALAWGEPFELARRTYGVRPPIDLTVREWLMQRGQTPRLIEMLWEPLAVAALNQSIDAASAESFRAVLSRMLAPPASNAALVLPTRPLDEMYALPAKRYIESRGGEVRTGVRAVIACGASLWGSPGETPPQRPSLGAGDPGSRLALRSAMVWPNVQPVICAVPWYALSDVFDAPPPQLAATIAAARHTAASPIVTVNLWFDRVVTDRPLLGLPGRTMQWMFDKRAVFGEAASHLSLVSSGAESAVALTNDELTAIALGEVTDALPAARGAQLVRSVVVREKRATFSVAPGQPPRPGTRTVVPGLFLAGDWIDTGLPATIEGAVASGHSAAQHAHAYLQSSMFDRNIDSPTQIEDSRLKIED